jgi:hypothetical protein
VVVGAVATFVVIIHVLMRLSLGMTALIAEAQPATGALRRSWRLTRGSLWRIAGYLLLVWIVTAIPSAIATAAVSIGFRPTVDYQTLTISYNPIGIFVATVVAAIVSAVVTPISGIVITLLYLDIRFRHGEQVPVPGVATT